MFLVRVHRPHLRRFRLPHIRCDNKKKFDPLRAKKIFIIEAEYGPYLAFSYKKDLSVTL